MSDLQLSAGAAQDLRPWEQDVADVVDAVLDGSSERLSRFRDRIEDDRESMHPRFTAFKEAVGREIRRRHWFWSIGAVPLITAVLFVVAGGVLVFLAQDGWRPVYPRYSDVLLVGAAICLLGNAVLVVASVIFGRRLWRRRAPTAQAEAERWDAFRRYLSDFPRLQEAPPRHSSSGSATSCTGLRSGSPSACCRVRSSRARGRPPGGSIWISSSGDLGSGAASLDRRSQLGVRTLLRRTQVPVEAAEASREEEAAEAGAGAAGSAEPRPARSQKPSGAAGVLVAPYVT